MPLAGCASLPHVLVVDDDGAILEAITTALRPTYRVHTAATGAEAFGILRTHPIAAIVLDVMLRDENGLDLVEGFRALSPAGILILTGHSTEELAIRAVWAKVHGYLKKPVSLDGLQHAVARLVPREGVPADPLAHIRRYLDSHLEKEIDLGDLARQMDWSQGHLRWRFREAYGMTPHRYLIAARLKRAAGLVLTTRLCIDEIAQRVGFSDMQRFRRRFKRHFGLSPSGYRLRHPRPANGDESGPNSPRP
jgi:YesN/AraC family two-component response regulator